MKACAVFCVLTVAIAVMNVSVAVATTLLYDDFNVSGNSNDLNTEIARQTGTMAPVSYGQTDTAGGIQIDSASAPGALSFTSSETWGTVWLKQNFNVNPGMGGYVSVSADILPVFGGGADASYLAFQIGASDGTPATTAPTGGTEAVFYAAGWCQVTGGLTNPGTNFTPGVSHHVEFRISDPVDGNPWNGVGTTDIALYVDGAASPLLTWTTAANPDNYIALIDSRDSIGASHSVDNLSVGVVPEPSTITLVGMGLILLIGLRLAEAEVGRMLDIGRRMVDVDNCAASPSAVYSNFTLR